MTEFNNKPINLNVDSNYQSDPEQPDYISPQQEIDRMIARSKMRTNQKNPISEEHESSESSIDEEPGHPNNLRFLKECDSSFRFLLDKWFDDEVPLEFKELEKLRDDLVHTLGEVQQCVMNWKIYTNRYDVDD